MQGFVRKFTQLNGAEVKVVLEHSLFDEQRFYCRQLQTINENERIGVVIKDREIFMYKQDLKAAKVKDDEYVISDGRLTITIKKIF